MKRGSLYDLLLVETEFRAAGMHDARAIEKTVEEAVRDALEACPLVLAIEEGPYVRMSASPKNFAPARNQDQTRQESDPTKEPEDSNPATGLPYPARHGSSLYDKDSTPASMPSDG